MKTKQFVRKEKITYKTAGKTAEYGLSFLKENSIVNPDGTRLPYLTFPKLDQLDMIRHAMTTREGGVSTGCYESMNLSYTRGDNQAHVSENYDRFMRVMKAPKNRVVAMDQKHTDTVIVVTEKDAGKGVTEDLDYSYVDGAVTNEKDLPLLIFAADCVPVFFVDPVRKAIGVCHSGWRGTVKRIGRKLIRTMEKEYGTEPKDLICAIGPSICRDCYEIGEDVAEIIKREFQGHAEVLLPDDKSHLDLWTANRIVLEEAGVPAGNIDVTDICTYCNPDLLFSHRRSGNSRGNNAGFLMLTDPAG